MCPGLTHPESASGTVCSTSPMPFLNTFPLCASSSFWISTCSPISASCHACMNSSVPYPTPQGNPCLCALTFSSLLHQLMPWDRLLIWHRYADRRTQLFTTIS